MSTYQTQKKHVNKNYQANFDELFSQQLKTLEDKEKEFERKNKFYNTFIEEKMELIEERLLKDHEK